MKILTSSEMKAIDRRAIEDIGIPGTVLMENAGIRILSALKRRFASLERERIVIVAGKGNNGGDGLVVARHLWNRGARPSVLLLASLDEVRGDAAVNLGIVRNMGIPVKEVRTPKDWMRARRALAGATLIVDALFGTGLTKPLSGLYAAAVAGINASKARKVAVDIPSGLSSDTPLVIGPCVRADLTVTLAAPKVALVLPPAERFVGELVVAPIGMPPSLLEDPALKLDLVEPRDAAAFFPARKRDAHKGGFGHVLVVGGSVGKTGAAALAGKAALKSGAGLVTVAAPAKALPAVARTMDELMTEPLPETPGGTISEAAVSRVLELLRGKSALLIGPGISTDPSTARFLEALLPLVRVPLVIDADGLNIAAADPRILDSLKAPAVLTPHPGEFGRLLGMTTAEILRNRIELARAFSRRHRVHLVLKGYRTLVVSPDGRVSINPTGNPGMATGGSGDVLGGIIAAQIAAVKDVRGATVSAVFVHGASGDLAAERLGQRSLVAGDLIRFLPDALKVVAG